MDRFSIIQRQVFNQLVVDEPNNCGQNQCVCDENLPSHKTDRFLLLMLTITAFLIAFVVAGKMNEANASILLAKRYFAISCGPKADNGQPGDKNNSSCSHQQGSLCETNNSKRKFLKIHHC